MIWGAGKTEGLDGNPVVMAGNILRQGYVAGIGMTIGTVFGQIAGREAARHAAR